MKKLLLIIFLFTTATVLAQNKSEKEVIIKSYDIETSTLEEFKNYNWNTVEEMFADNKSDDLVSISIAYKPDKNATKTKISYKMKGKVSELPNMIEKLKKFVENYKE